MMSPPPPLKFIIKANRQKYGSSGRFRDSPTTSGINIKEDITTVFMTKKKTNQSHLDRICLAIDQLVAESEAEKTWPGPN